MAEQRELFECRILDAQAKERFRAKAVFVKKHPVALSKHDMKQLELAHIYISALSDTWKGASVSSHRARMGE